MSTWRTKLFGDNRMNLYGWIGAGLLVLVGSFWVVVRAMRMYDGWALHVPECLLLVAVYLVLWGQFGLALQNYCARVAEKLDAQSEQGRSVSE